MNKLTKFLDVKNLTNDSADIYFYGDIISSEWGKWEDTDTTPEDVRNILDQTKDAKNLNIYVNSGGGSVFAGLAITNMLKRHTAYKTVYVDGVAASIASVIAMAGDKLVMPSNAFLMIHKPWSGAVGNANDFRKAADDLDRIETGLLNVYQDNLAEGVDINTIQEMVNAETWLNGKEASKFFNIEVQEANNSAASASDYYKKYYKVPEELKVENKQPENKPPVAPAILDKTSDSVTDEQIEAMLLELELI